MTTRNVHIKGYHDDCYQHNRKHIKLWLDIIRSCMPNSNKGLVTNKERSLFEKQRQPKRMFRNRFAEREIQKLYEATKL